MIFSSVPPPVIPSYSTRGMSIIKKGTYSRNHPLKGRNINVFGSIVFIEQRIHVFKEEKDILPDDYHYYALHRYDVAWLGLAYCQ